MVVRSALLFRVRSPPPTFVRSPPTFVRLPLPRFVRSPAGRPPGFAPTLGRFAGNWPALGLFAAPPPGLFATPLAGVDGREKLPLGRDGREVTLDRAAPRDMPLPPPRDIPPPPPRPPPPRMPPPPPRPPPPRRWASACPASVVRATPVRRR